MIHGLFLLALAFGPPAHGAMFLPKSLKEVQKLYKDGRYDEVIQRLSPDALQSFHGDDLEQAYLYLALSYEQGGHLAKALGVYQLGVKLYPKDTNFIAHLGNLLHHAGLEEQAQPLYQQVLLLSPDNAEAHRGLAEIDASLGFLDRSRDHYIQALQSLGESEPGIWRDYADILRRLKEYPAAESAARKALALAPNLDSQIELAFIERSEGKLPDALKLLADAAQQNPRSSGIVLLRCLWLLEADRAEEALPPVEAVIQEFPNDPLARWIRASIELKQNHSRLAAQDLEIAARQEQDAPFVAEASSAMLKWLNKQ